MGAALLAALGTAVAFGVGAVNGYLAGRRQGRAAAFREVGHTRKSAKLYHRAAQLLNRLVRVTDLDGDFAVDILSNPTQRQVNKWLAAYRKEINR